MKMVSVFLCEYKEAEEKPKESSLELVGFEALSHDTLVPSKHLKDH